MVSAERQAFIASAKRVEFPSTFHWKNIRFRVLGCLETITQIWNTVSDLCFCRVLSILETISACRESHVEPCVDEYMTTFHPCFILLFFFMYSMPLTYLPVGGSHTQLTIRLLPHGFGALFMVYACTLHESWRMALASDTNCMPSGPFHDESSGSSLQGVPATPVTRSLVAREPCTRHMWNLIMPFAWNMCSIDNHLRCALYFFVLHNNCTRGLIWFMACVLLNIPKSHTNWRTLDVTIVLSALFILPCPWSHAHLCATTQAGGKTPKRRALRVVATHTRHVTPTTPPHLRSGRTQTNTKPSIIILMHTPKTCHGSNNLSKPQWCRRGTCSCCAISVDSPHRHHIEAVAETSGARGLQVWRDQAAGRIHRQETCRFEDHDWTSHSLGPCVAWAVLEFSQWNQVSGVLCTHVWSSVCDYMHTYFKDGHWAPHSFGSYVARTVLELSQ